jgi:hypothetical protein
LKYLIILLLFFTCVSLYSQGIKIKTLKVYTNVDQTSVPILNSGKDFLILDFDVQADYPPNFSVIYKFCDRDWNPTDNIFLANQGQNTVYNLDYFTLPTTVENANYHFNNRFPDKDGYVSFPFSGKWRFYIVDPQDESLVYADGRFFVVDADIQLNTKFKKETLDDYVYSPPNLGRVNWITTDFSLKEEYFPFYVDELEILQNHLLDYSIKVKRNSTDQNRVFEWDGRSKLKFIAKDVRPGNEYRQVDLRDINIFNSKNVKAQFDGMEYERFYIQGHKDLDGGFILKSPKDIYSTYMNVTFSVKPPPEVTGDIYLVGAFNDWRLSENNIMNFDGDHFLITIPLKRGIYDYQYVVVSGDYKNQQDQDWYVLEGNNWETVNEYNIFLWYRDPDKGGFDRIIGYSKIVTR